MQRSPTVSESSTGYGSAERRARNRRLWKTVLGVVYPPRCPVCDGLLKPGEAAYRSCRIAGESFREIPGVHAACRERLALIHGSVCMRCGRPIESGRDEFCYDCGRRRDRNASYRQGKALFTYSEEMKVMMYRFKYRGRREYAEYFAKAAASVYGDWLAQIGIEAVVPVPMFWRKQRRRGYNQAECFARELAGLIGLPCESLVRRVRDTRPMKELDDAERIRNLKGAFEYVGNRERTHRDSQESLPAEYSRVLLVDDIYTTGMTAEAVSEALHRGGVEEIFLMSICIGKGF